MDISGCSQGGRVEGGSKRVSINGGEADVYLSTRKDDRDNAIGRTAQSPRRIVESRQAVRYQGIINIIFRLSDLHILG